MCVFPPFKAQVHLFLQNSFHSLGFPSEVLTACGDQMPLYAVLSGPFWYPLDHKLDLDLSWLAPPKSGCQYLVIWHRFFLTGGGGGNTGFLVSTPVLLSPFPAFSLGSMGRFALTSQPLIHGPFSDIFLAIQIRLPTAWFDPLPWSFLLSLSGW